MVYERVTRLYMSGSAASPVLACMGEAPMPYKNIKSFICSSRQVVKTVAVIKCGLNIFTNSNVKKIQPLSWVRIPPAVPKQLSMLCRRHPAITIKLNVSGLLSNMLFIYSFNILLNNIGGK